jgi:hypothetical protein
MNIPRTSAVGLAVTAVLAGATLVGCGNDKGETKSSTSSASASSAASTPSSAASSTAAQPTDYTTLLIKPEDIGNNVVPDAPPVINPSGVNGIGQTFRNKEGTRFVIDTIGVMDDAAAAAATIPNMKDVIVGKKISGQPEPVDVGTNGFVVTGASADGSKSLTEIVFTQGRALIDLEFASNPGDPVPPEAALEVAHKQGDAVKAGLPG